jgi:hypothetical protein
MAGRGSIQKTAYAVLVKSLIIDSESSEITRPVAKTAAEAHKHIKNLKNPLYWFFIDKYEYGLEFNYLISLRRPPIVEDILWLLGRTRRRHVYKTDISLSNS